MRLTCIILKKLTLSMLEGLDVLAAGLGLAAFMLILLLAPGSGIELNRFAWPGAILVGLAGRFAAPLPFVATGLAGCSRMITAAGLTNIPLPISQSKYLSP